ncbi:MAG: nickel pincer cofactor biosynthesis protein LarC [Coriobacteriia bacterium]|nr:nickel pincer cofactor biosynthesis protein LarC [Coriobacteriia bacterium]
MARTLILDGGSGISGDMTVAALLDAGASEEHLREALATLPVDGFETVVSRVEKSGLSACDFDVRLDAAHENHDHDMAWLYGAGDEHVHVHGHAHGHASSEPHHHAHTHRTLSDVTAIINASQLSDHAKELALAVFGKLAEAEAKAHGATPDTVHFHEVGAVDSIVDICAVAVCLDDLGVTDVIVPSLAEGHGTIRCAHGLMPIPVPAVAHLCADAGIVLEAAPVHGELVTPTGAAIVAALRTSDALPARYRILATGYGAGKRPYPNVTGVLRATLAEADGAGRPTNAPHQHPADDDPSAEHIVVELTCDLDDCTGEALGRTIELLMDAGARDAHAVPIVMKKGRPAYQLEVVCDESNEAQLRDLIFMNTTTIGIRATRQRRYPLRREPGTVATRYGEVATKRVVLPDGSVRSYPEYGSVVEACEQTGVSFQEVFLAVQTAAFEGR